MLLSERFWSKVDKSGDCWLWTAGKSIGYGIMNVDGRPVRAHVVAFYLREGRWPTLNVLHSCGVKLCVRHIYEGTQADNAADAKRLGEFRPYQRERIHCKRGHLWDARDSEGFRMCRRCKRETNRASARRRRL